MPDTRNPTGAFIQTAYRGSVRSMTRRLIRTAAAVKAGAHISLPSTHQRQKPAVFTLRVSGQHEDIPLAVLCRARTAFDLVRLAPGCLVTVARMVRLALYDLSCNERPKGRKSAYVSTHVKNEW